jgi:DNA-binding response OmpR family regulator
MQLIRMQLSTWTEFALECVDCLSAGFTRIEHGGVDVVLLDLNLPDSSGLDTFIDLHSRAPNIPIVVLTSTDDESLAAKAVGLGAQDYLVKGKDGSGLLGRSLRYAIERNQLQVELELARKKHEHEKELRLLQLALPTSSNPVTAESLGHLTLRQTDSALFLKFVEEYGTVIDLALEQRTLKVDHDLRNRLCTMADQMGIRDCSPRDVIEIYSSAVKSKSTGLPSKVHACNEEARMILVELMGRLCSHYRMHSIGTGSTPH